MLLDRLNTKIFIQEVELTVFVYEH